MTLLAHLIAAGQIAPPETLTVLYADTRMELPPLHACALTILNELAQRGMRTQVVLPDLDDRFFVSLFGRGVPAPKNRFRWCTSQLKIEPMERALADLRQATGEKLLMLTGVRLGESAARDSRIALSCDRDGTECGQGWFQEATPDTSGRCAGSLVALAGVPHLGLADLSRALAGVLHAAGRRILWRRGGRGDQCAYRLHRLQPGLQRCGARRAAEVATVGLPGPLETAQAALHGD